MFVPVRIVINDEAIYSRGFVMLAEDAKDMTAPLSVIGGRLIEDVGAQFGTEGAWSGNPWAELSPVYGEWKEKHAPGTPKLVGLKPEHKGTREHPTRPQHYTPSGKMRAELLDVGSVSVSQKRMLYAPVSNIAGFHEFGTEKMPARPPVEVPVGELHEWDRVFVQWMNGLISQAGLTG
jgi:hypothetical protein